MNESKSIIHLPGASLRESWAVMAAVVRMDLKSAERRESGLRPEGPRRDIPEGSERPGILAAGPESH